MGALRGPLRRAVWVLALLLFGLVPALPAFAHATPVVTAPRSGDRLEYSPEAVRLQLTQPVELPFSRVEVYQGRTLVSDRAALHLDGSRTLVQPLPPLGPGRYDVTWRVLSTDGHVTEGSLWFVVAEGAAGASVPAAAPAVAGGGDWSRYAVVLVAAVPLAILLLAMRGRLRW